MRRPATLLRRSDSPPRRRTQHAARLSGTRGSYWLGGRRCACTNTQLLPDMIDLSLNLVSFLLQVAQRISEYFSVICFRH